MRLFVFGLLFYSLFGSTLAAPKVLQFGDTTEPDEAIVQRVVDSEAEARAHVHRLLSQRKVIRWTQAQEAEDRQAVLTDHSRFMFSARKLDVPVSTPLLRPDVDEHVEWSLAMQPRVLTLQEHTRSEEPEGSSKTSEQEQPKQSPRKVVRFDRPPRKVIRFEQGAKRTVIRQQAPPVLDAATRVQAWDQARKHHVLVLSQPPSDPLWPMDPRAVVVRPMEDRARVDVLSGVQYHNLVRDRYVARSRALLRQRRFTVVRTQEQASAMKAHMEMMIEVSLQLSPVSAAPPANNTIDGAAPWELVDVLDENRTAVEKQHLGPSLVLDAKGRPVALEQPPKKHWPVLYAS